MRRIRFPQEWHYRPVATWRYFQIQLPAFLSFPGPSGFSPACRGDVASPLPGNHGRAHPCSSPQSCSPDATHSQKSESNDGLAHPYLSAQPCTPFGTKCHPGGGPAPGGGPEGPPGAAITWAGVGGFDGWAANQTKDAATPAPPINAPTIKFQIILSLCHASFTPMSHLVF